MGIQGPGDPVRCARIKAGTAPLDLQTGGGEVLASISSAPPLLFATECGPPNVELARRNLAALGAQVVAMDDELDDLPFADSSFDEIARVLKRGRKLLLAGCG
jgi:hypothetical protein